MTTVPTTEVSADAVRAQIIEEVRAWAARKRLTQVALADRAGMATSTLNRRLNGESDFTTGELYRIAKVFGISAHQLIPAGAA